MHIIRFVLLLFMLNIPFSAYSIPHDAPIGAKQIWNGATWGYALDPDNETSSGELFITREMRRLNELNINYMRIHVPRPSIQIDKYNSGDLQVRFVAEHHEDLNNPDAPWDYSTFLHRIFWRYATTRHADAYDGNIDTYAEAQSLVNVSIERMQNDYMHQNAFLGYFLWGEIWGREHLTGIHSTSHLLAFQLGNHAVEKIRERDKVNPIFINHRYMYAYNKDSYETDLVFRTPYTNAFAFTGWNVFLNFDYQFDVESNEYSGEVTNYDYCGDGYYENRWEKLIYGHRELSQAIEDYYDLNEDVLYGIKPEWRHAIQFVRTWNSNNQDPDPTGITHPPTWVLKKRRPTHNEYRMEAYCALASGAKGISGWPYFGKRRGVPPFFLSGINTDPEMLDPDEEPDDYIDELDEGQTVNIFEGIIKPTVLRLADIPDETLDPDGYEQARNEFRAPYSTQTDIGNDTGANAGCPDEDFDEPYHPESYNDESYPYEKVSELNANLEDLLPIIRPLRWWWGVMPSQNSGNDQGRVGSNYNYTKYNLFDTMNGDITRFGVTELQDRFSLNEVSGYESDGTLFSNIYVGMFGNPAEGDIGTLPNDPDIRAEWLDGSEYYFIVNLKCNEDNGSYIEDAALSTITLSFEAENNAAAQQMVLETVWKGTASDTQLGNPTVNNQYVNASLTLEPGDAILLKVTKHLNVLTGRGYIGNRSTSLTGKYHFTGDVSVALDHSLYLDGDFTFDGNLTVSGQGSYLKIKPGSSIKFADDKGIIVSDLAKIFVDGSEDHPVNFLSKEINDDAGKWDGITLGEMSSSLSNSDITIRHAKFKNAVTGVRFVKHGYNRTIKLENLEVAYSDTGIVCRNAYVANIDNCNISRCKIGIYAGRTGTGTAYLRIRGCTIDEIDRYGVQIDQFAYANISSCTIQRTQKTGLYVNGVDHLIINGYPEAASFPGKTFIQYCGLSNSSTYQGIKLSNTHVDRFNASRIVENGGQGILLSVNADIPGGTYNHSNLFANNGLIMDDGSSKVEIAINSGCEFDFPNGNYAVYNNEIYQGDAKLFWIYCNTGFPTHYLDIRGNFWKDVNTTPTTFKNEQISIFPTGAPLSINVSSPIAAINPSNYSNYWDIASVSSPESRLNIAYELLNDTNITEEDLNHAQTIFVELIEEKYAPAIKGLTNVLKRKDYSSSQIQFELGNYLTEENSNTLNRYISFANASVDLNFGEYESAILHFEDIVDTTNFIGDSLNALIGIQEALRLQLMLENGGGSSIQSAGQRSASILRIEERLDELNNELSSHLFGKHNCESTIPTDYKLEKAYPNPFNPSVTIPYTLPEISRVKISVYNILGQKVATLLNRQMIAGRHNVIWQSVTDSGISVASGIYFVKMEAGDFVQTQKIILMK